ncbi:glycosyltransferase [Pedobacter psychrodurus]|uniref:Glycosyltransferase n=1 Tax=Pedobacter psychrodurus TaxID=2530456 RepID=A0A4R0PJQ1_9SPHI|nr:glycosyltransferase [Pedobacter psychrodurus]TCD17341.1 glycosyltransferase [Pedobacter psychrodurus]
MEQIKVSVIICTYNQEATISRALDSVLGQKGDFTYEIIIGEDGSPLDNTRKVCEDYQQKFPEIIHLLPKAPNKGFITNFRDCLASTKGKYIAICSGDDFWHNTNKLQEQIEFLDNNSNFGLVYTDFKILNVDRKTTESDFYKTKGITPPIGKIYYHLIHKNPIAACTVLFRKSLVDNYLNFQSYIDLEFGMEDYPMWLEFSQHTEFMYIPTSTLTYSIADGSLSNNLSDLSKIEKFEQKIFKIKQHFLSKYPLKGILVQNLLDIHYSELVAKAVIGGHYKQARLYAKKLNKLKPVNVVKILVCYTPLIYLYKKRLLGE